MRNDDLPAGDREDTPEPPKVQREGEGLIATLERLAKDPSIVPPKKELSKHEQGISDFYDTPGRVEFGD